MASRKILVSREATDPPWGSKVAMDSKWGHHQAIMEDHRDSMARHRIMRIGRALDSRSTGNRGTGSREAWFTACMGLMASCTPAATRRPSSAPAITREIPLKFSAAYQTPAPCQVWLLEQEGLGLPGPIPIGGCSSKQCRSVTCHPLSGDSVYTSSNRTSRPLLRPASDV